MIPDRTFLWLTDFHCGGARTKAGGVAEEYDSEVMRAIKGFLESLAANQQTFTFIAVGGDLTDRGSPAGLKQFQEELFPALLPLVKDQKKAICIVPGNHDVKWGEDPDNSDYFERKFSRFIDLVDSPQVGSTTCIFPTYQNEKKIAFSDAVHDPVFLNDTPDAKTLVLNINSAVRCGELDKSYRQAISKLSKRRIRYPAPKNTPKEMRPVYDNLIDDLAHVTDQQLERLRVILSNKKKALGTDWESYLRVAVVHHQLLPYTSQIPDDRRFQHMVDSNRVLNLLDDFEFHIALSGHTHASYEYNYLLPSGRQIVLIGGFTVGGGASEGMSRGIRHISVRSLRYQYQLSIRDVTFPTCVGDALEVLKSAPCHPSELHAPLDKLVVREIDLAGYGCDEIISSIRVSNEGDAYRTTDYRGYRILKGDNPFLCEKTVTLPWTSGEIDDDVKTNLQGHTVSVRESGEPRVKRLFFDSCLHEGIKYNYDIRWVAKNAFALDKLQYALKYSDVATDDPKELAFFIPDLPAHRLILLVQFPLSYSLDSKPQVTVAKIGDPNSSPRDWAQDEDETKELGGLEVVQAIPVVNQFMVKIDAPRIDRCYRISWKLNESSIDIDPSSDELAIRQFLATTVLTESGIVSNTHEELFMKHLSAMLGLVINSPLCMRDLERHGGMKLDASLMIWGLPQFEHLLKLVVAIQDDGKGTTRRLNYDLHLGYGIGIAGRTMKMNQFEVWENIPKPKKNINPHPNFYVSVAGVAVPKHRNLVSVPLHIPVRDALFSRRPSIYNERPPLAVLSVGGDIGMLSGIRPGQFSREDETTINSALQQAQHDLNKGFMDMLKNCGYSDRF